MLSLDQKFSKELVLHQSFCCNQIDTMVHGIQNFELKKNQPFHPSFTLCVRSKKVAFVLLLSMRIY